MNLRRMHKRKVVLGIVRLRTVPRFIHRGSKVHSVVSTTGESSYAVVTAPCGLLQLTLGNNHSADEVLHIEFEVLDISDM